MNSGLITKLNGWFSQPFNENMNVTGWFLFIGLIILIMFAWSRVIARIGE